MATVEAEAVDHGRVPGERVRLAGPGDLGAARTVLARALAHDPLMDWIFGTRPHRYAAVATFLWSAVDAYVVAGTTWLAVDDDGRAVGAAAWRVPGTEPPGASAGPHLPGASTLGMLVGEAHAAHVADGFAAMAALPHDDHEALLHFLGVDADRRGRGIGGALVRAGIAVMPPGLPLRVNTTLDANVRLYESLGFVHAGRVRLGDGPVMHALRHPGPG